MKFVGVAMSMAFMELAVHLAIWQHAPLEAVSLGGIRSLDNSFQGISFLCAGCCELLQPASPL